MVKLSKSKDVTVTAIKDTDVTVAPVVEIKKMKSIVLTSTGSGSDYSNLQVKDEEYPKIGEGVENMVIIRMKAVGLNFAELMQRQGTYKPSSKTPYTPGYEGSGIVEEVSGNVTDLQKDDHVLIFNQSGTWKECVMVPRSNVVKMPENMTFEDAAGFLVNYLTAYQILFRMANIKEGDTVLIHMAAGGVGVAATQLCKTIPNVTIFGTASASKHEAIKEIGVDYPIDYTAADYVEQIRKISAEGVDVVMDPLNGENSIKGYDLLKPLGRIVHYGAASMTGESRSLANMFKTWWKCLSINSLEIISENKSVSGYHLGFLLNTPSFMATATKDIDTLLKMWSEGKIKVQIDSQFGFSKVGEAMKKMHQRLNVGKIILKPDSEMPVVEPVVEEVTASLEEVKISEGEKKQEEEEVVTEAKPEEGETKSEAHAAVERAEDKIIEKTNVSEITKPEATETVGNTRE